jgi:hypothetical protein
MRCAVVALFAVCASAGWAFCDSAAQSAERKSWSFDLPPGFIELQTPVDAVLVMARTFNDVRAADAHIYETADGARLVQFSFQSGQGRDVAWSDLERDDTQLVGKLKARPNIKVISESSRRDVAILIAETTGEMDGRPFVMRRIYGADEHDVTHALMIMCGGAEARIAECTTAVQSMRLDIEKQVMPASKSSGEKERDDAIFGLATIILLALGIGVFGLRQSGRGPAWLRRNL